MPIIVKQFGFANGGGAIANIADGDLSTFWQPLATDFAGYPAQFFLSDRTTLNTAASFPALEFDLGEERRVPQFLLKVETGLTLGPGILIGADTGATGVADTLVAGNILLDQYTAQQLCSNQFLAVAAMKNADIRKRFLRLLQRSNLAAVVAPSPGPANSQTYDAGTGFFVVPSYTGQFIAEVWGSGASGGVSANAQNGASSFIGNDAIFVIEAGGGSKSAATTPNATSSAAGGTVVHAGNTINASGQNGGQPEFLSTANGLSGAGGNAGDGFGGAPAVGPSGAPAFYSLGIDGLVGGGGSGRNVFTSSGGGTDFKYPGGAGGAYVKHVTTRGAGGPEPGDLFGWGVGNGGVSSQGDGRGANGRARFSWT